MPGKSPKGRYIVFPKVIYPLNFLFLSYVVYYYFIYLVQHLLNFGTLLGNATAHLPLLMPKANLNLGKQIRALVKVTVSYCAKKVNPSLHSIITTILPDVITKVKSTQ